MGSSATAINVANFVSTKLRGKRDRNNYKTWREQMLCLVESQGLVGFIDGNARPPNEDDDVVVEWRRTDWLVKGWILGALSDEALQNVVHLDSARGVWLELENQAEQAIYIPRSAEPLSDQLSWIHQDAPQPWSQQCNFRSDQLSSIHQDAPQPPPRRQQAVSPSNHPHLPSLTHQAPPRPPPRRQQAVSPSNHPHLPSLTHQAAPRPPPPRQQEKEWLEYLPLYKAAMMGEWDRAEVILKQDPDAIKARVSYTLETALHVAVASGKSTSFVEKLVKLSDDSTLYMTDEIGYNPLHTAARTGNLGAAQILIQRLPHLLYVPTHRDRFPLHLAADCGHRETLELIISHTRDDLTVNPFAGERCLVLFILFIDAGFLDMALDLVDKYPHLARINSPSFGTALNKFALKDTTLYGDTRLNSWERLVYSCIHVEVEYSHQLQSSLDIESQILEPQWWCKVRREWNSTLWKKIIHQVLCIKRIHDMKVMREQALRLVKCICKHMESLSANEASAIYTDAMQTAARLGSHEVVEIIVAAFPPAIHSEDAATKQGFLHWAVGNRCEKVFNLLYQTTNHRCYYSDRIDSLGNSILHLAGTLAPTHKLNLVPGAALQMQREIQWFKEAHKFVGPFIKGLPNKAGKTPEMIFSEQHRDLKVEGEKWMKDTANSCTIAAALIVTVVFAAAITVPGGNESETGYPMLWRASAFTIFAVSDAISLFTSTTSLLMFLSILTSRYAEEDFLCALPKRLIMGLVTLFLSILFMMAAFCSTVFLVFGRKNAWVLIPAAALTSLPITSFVLLQFPLLIDVVSSTYGKGIFGKQSDRPFH